MILQKCLNGKCTMENECTKMNVQNECTKMNVQKCTMDVCTK